MEKKNKTILISIVSVIILVIIIAAVIFFVSKGNNNVSIDSNQKVTSLYNILKSKEKYSFRTTYNNENSQYYAKQSDTVSYLDIVYNGNENKLLSKNGNQYLIVDDDKAYYTYQNNESDLNLVETNLEGLVNLEYTTGKEQINNKEYYYEEYVSLTEFAFADFEENEVKTRFYFENNNLVYIKTIGKEDEELLKVEVSDQIDKSAIFEIPSDYQEN